MRIAPATASATCLTLVLLAVGCPASPAPARETDRAAADREAAARSRIVPRAAYHQHLLSPAAAALLRTPRKDAAAGATAKPFPYPPQITADDLIRELDAAGIRRAVVLSTAYFFASPQRDVTDRYAKLRADNDWTIEQAERYPDRLVVFCGVNPLAAHAIDELERCSKFPIVKGMKLHFGNSQVDVTNPDHVAQVRRLFRAANERRMAIVVHLWTSFGNYGARQAEIFLAQILPEAPDIPVQIAHLAGAGPGYEHDEDDALAVYAAAIERRDPRMRQVWFDVTTNVIDSEPPATTALIVRRLREIGLARVLFGSDMSLPGNPPVGEQWATLRRKLPLTSGELEILASNTPPYLARPAPDKQH